MSITIRMRITQWVACAALPSGEEGNQVRNTTRGIIAVAAGMVVAIFAAVAPASAGDIDRAPGIAEGPRANAYSCDSGYYCVYTGWDGTGDRCQYHSSVKDMWNDPGRCSWANSTNAKSVRNRTGKTVTLYTKSDYNGRVGSTAPDSKGNLQGTYKLRSLKIG
jgi:hypothetical protein